MDLLSRRAFNLFIYPSRRAFSKNPWYPLSFQKEGKEKAFGADYAAVLRGIFSPHLKSHQ